MTHEDVMAERAQLIAKKFGVGLGAEEAERLEFLNQEAGRLCPRVSEGVLKSLDEMVSRHEGLAREIDELLRMADVGSSQP